MAFFRCILRLTHFTLSLTPDHLTISYEGCWSVFSYFIWNWPFQVRQLTHDTLTCRNCGQRLIADIPAPDIQYCSCGSKCLAVQIAPGGWVPFIERKDLLVWRRECGAHPGLFEYKLYGVYPEVSPDIFLQVQVTLINSRETSLPRQSEK